MRGVYAHISPRMRKGLVTGLQELWEKSLAERATLSRRSVVSALDRLLNSSADPM